MQNKLFRALFRFGPRETGEKAQRSARESVASALDGISDVGDYRIEDVRQVEGESTIAVDVIIDALALNIGEQMKTELESEEGFEQVLSQGRSQDSIRSVS